MRNLLVILSGLLEQQARLDPHEIMSDTHGSSDVVLELLALLGSRFSPRLVDLADQRFSRIKPHAEEGVLNDLSRYLVNTRLIAEHWDDLLRLAGSLKPGRGRATSVMRTLQRGASFSGLGRAAAELGRIGKTLYLLAYVHDESYRDVSWCSSTVGRDETRWPGQCFTAVKGNSGGRTGKAWRIS